LFDISTHRDTLPGRSKHSQHTTQCGLDGTCCYQHPTTSSVSTLTLIPHSPYNCSYLQPVVLAPAINSAALVSVALTQCSTRATRTCCSILTCRFVLSGRQGAADGLRPEQSTPSAGTTDLNQHQLAPPRTSPAKQLIAPPSGCVRRQPRGPVLTIR
jgi:hypothetical protein